MYLASNISPEKENSVIVYSQVIPKLVWLLYEFVWVLVTFDFHCMDKKTNKKTSLRHLT